MTCHRPTQWQPILKGDQLTRASCHPSRYEQVKEHNFQANFMKCRRIQCYIFKCFNNQSDTYHDTRTHYLMDQDLLLLQDQAGGMDTAATDR
jgi:hypothetical protein